MLPRGFLASVLELASTVPVGSILKIVGFGEKNEDCGVRVYVIVDAVT